MPGAQGKGQAGNGFGTLTPSSIVPGTCLAPGNVNGFGCERSPWRLKTEWLKYPKKGKSS